MLAQQRQKYLLLYVEISKDTVSVHTSIYITPMDFQKKQSMQYPEIPKFVRNIFR